MFFSNISLIKNILEIEDIQNFHDFLFTVPYFFRFETPDEEISKVFNDDSITFSQ